MRRSNDVRPRHSFLSFPPATMAEMIGRRHGMLHHTRLLLVERPPTATHNGRAESLSRQHEETAMRERRNGIAHWVSLAVFLLATAFAGRPTLADDREPIGAECVGEREGRSEMSRSCLLLRRPGDCLRR